VEKSPVTSTIRNWYRVVDGTPGFTKEALDAIKIRAEERENAGKPIIVNLVSNEMVIRKEMVFDKTKFTGGVDVGTITSTDDIDSDNNNNEAIEPAGMALMFMELV